MSCKIYYFSGYGTVGRSSGGGMASMMDEMQKTLARRRAKVDRGSEEPDSDRQENGERRGSDFPEKGSSPGKVISQPGSQAGSESPKPGRRRHSTRGSQDIESLSGSMGNLGRATSLGAQEMGTENHVPGGPAWSSNPLHPIPHILPSHDLMRIICTEQMNKNMCHLLLTIVWKNKKGVC